MKKIIRHMADTVGPYLFQGLENVKNAISELSTTIESKFLGNSLEDYSAEDWTDIELALKFEILRASNDKLQREMHHHKKRRPLIKKHIAEKGQNENLNKENSNLQANECNLHTEIQNLNIKVRDLQAVIATLNNSNTDLHQQNGNLRAKNENLSQENGELRAEILNRHTDRCDLYRQIHDLNIKVQDLQTTNAIIKHLDACLSQQNENLREENGKLERENRELRAGIFRVKDNLDDDDDNRVLLSEVLSIAGTGMSSPYITLETRDTDEDNHLPFSSDFD